MLLVVAAVVVCLVPMPEMPQAFDWNDKVSHMIGHGTAGAVFRGSGAAASWWKIFVFLLLFGIAIEFAQYFMHAGRQGDPRDVLANSTGAVAGSAARAAAGCRRWPDSPPGC